MEIKKGTIDAKQLKVTNSGNATAYDQIDNGGTKMDKTITVTVEIEKLDELKELTQKAQDQLNQLSKTMEQIEKIKVKVS